MKNALSYIAASEPACFDKESELMAKVQIDNSLELGWKIKDIVLLTDFPFSYNGVEAIIMDQPGYVRGRRTRGFNKVLTILWLYKHGYFDSNVFFHDLDAFQNIPFFECPDEQYKSFELTCAPYGDGINYNAGCMFFKPSALKIWGKIQQTCLQLKTDEEKAITYLYPHGKQTEVAMLDISYNVGKGDTTKKWTEGFQPSRIIHFHPAMRRNYDYYVLGRNELQKPLVCDRLGRLITKHFRSVV